MFIVVTAAILGGILAFALISVKFLIANEILRRKLYKIFISADFFFIAVILGGWAVRSLVPQWFIAFFGNIATIFLMSQLFCGIFVVFALILRFFYRKFHKPTKFDAARRRVLAYGLIYPAMSFALSIYGNRIEKNSDEENFYDVPIKNLPPELENFRLAQISDVHLGAYYSLERLKNLLQRISDAKPDFLAITGDIFDDVRMNPDAIKLVDSFTDKFRYGIFYIHGNHEHFRGIRLIEQMLAETRIKWLVNRSESVTANLYVLGVDYPQRAPVTSTNDAAQEKIFADSRRNLVNKALENVPTDAICILLAHHPEFIDDGAERRFALTLTGHTHGSQFGIFGLPLFPVFKYTRGLVKNGESLGYVHVGNGSWFPLRVGCPPEIAYFTLKKTE